MSSRHSPGKVTLGMIRDKPITKSVPIIRYHANDEDVKEVYLSADDEKQCTPESERLSPRCSPRKSSKDCKNKCEDTEDLENDSDSQFVSIDDNFSEGTPPSDPWRVLSELRGKITKTFEEKLLEIKSDRKKRKHRSRENSSVSDSEDLGDVTPTDENVACDQQQMETVSPIPTKKDNPSRFVAFSQIRTGLKTKQNSEDDSVESGIEAAELTTDTFNAENFTASSDVNGDGSVDNRRPSAMSNAVRDVSSQPTGRTLVPAVPDKQPATIFSQLRDQVLHELISRAGILFVTHLCFYYVISLPDYILGLITGLFVAATLQNAVGQICNILSNPPRENPSQNRTVPVVEIPAAEEHAVIEKFEGWLNELPYPYDPDNYHVARTRSVYFRLERDILHVMEAKSRIPKRTVWDEPKHKLKFTRRRKYKLTGARVELLPEGLIKRRRWSKKYPICITLREDALIENTILKDASEGEEEDLGKTRLSDGRIDHVIADETGGEDEEDEETTDDENHGGGPREVFQDCLGSNDCAGLHNDGRGLYCRMFIFARADRQKEDWYRRLVSAASFAKRGNGIVSLTDTSAVSLSSLLMQENDYEPTKSMDVHDGNSNGSSTGSTGSTGAGGSGENSAELAYNNYMSRYLDVTKSLDSEKTATGGKDDSWVNCLIGRILFDVHKCPDTINLVQDKIQRKLSNIKLPYFMESLLVTEVTIGQGAPIFENAKKPIVDERGLWFELDVTYKGCLTMTVETKLNLMKLTRAGSVYGNSHDTLVLEKPKSTRSPIFDSDVEDSPETSTEDEDGSAVPCVSATSKELTSGQSSGRKFLNIVDKLAASKYFQHATELSYIRRALEGVSNTEIRLMVNVSGIEGRLAVNIPPPPSDRLWYGFKPVPKVALTVKPALGERAVNIVYVTKWIETKLLREFEKVVVLPNMDDVVIPLCPNYPYVS